ncbi:MAG TPA: putative monovalent cation/H+ antiporter subunit A [Aggregatilineales bacterium]|nr:putative monovalent cation/H+ antiporter subunit A [Aggregatilineales bacterium]
MLLAVLSGFIVAFLVPYIHHVTRHVTGWILALLPLALTIYFARFIGRISDGEIIAASYEWVPGLDVNLTFTLDSLSLIFSLLVSGIGTLVVIYAGGYLHGHPLLGRFYVYLLMFMASMLGLVLSDNIITLFAFWELTSFTSYLLISFYNDQYASREAAKTALIVTGAGGLAMLAGLVLLGIIAQTWEISAMIPLHEEIRADSLYLPALILILIGAFSKSAQFPFHFWLPAAMEAPAPVSAYLHSATMVKAGVYLLARMHPILGKTDEWQVILIAVGGITMLLGGYVAWQQTDIKRILAYTTIGALGMLVFLLGIGTGTAVKAALIFLVVHSFYKGALFMVGGTIDHETGTRDITNLGGLASVMPFTFAAAGLAALSMSGIPPLVGFIGKEVIYESTLHPEDLPANLLTIAAILGNAFNVTAAAMVVIRPFFGAKVETPKHAHEGYISLWLGPVLLGIGSLTLGIFTTQLYKPLLTPGVEAVYGKAYEVSHLDFIELLTDPGTSLLLSVITIVLGLVLFAGLDRLRDLAKPVDMGRQIGTAEDGYQAIMNGILGIANWQSRWITGSYLRYHIRIIIVLFSVFLLYILASESTFSLNDIKTPDVRFYEVVILLVIAGGAVTVTIASTRWQAIIALGSVGYGVAVIFILFGAPDLAMTQFSIETLTVFLFVLVIYRLPDFIQFTSATSDRIIDATIAIVSGAIIMVLVLIITSEPLQSRLTPFFSEASLQQAHGHNVVNVILVDFRGFDTMGEITVLSTAAIGVFALLNLNLNKSRRDKKSEGESQHQDQSEGENEES